MHFRAVWRRPYAYLAALAALVLVLTAGAGSNLGKVEWRHITSRAGWQLPDRVIEALEIQPGDKVADIGAGRGYFTFRLAEAVGPEGAVFAVEVKDDLVDELRAKAREAGRANVQVIRARPDDPLLPDGQLDIVFLCNTYHHIKHRREYFDRLRRNLSPRGRVAVVDLKGGLLARLTVPAGHWTAVETLEDEMNRAHYRRVASFAFLPLQNYLVFAPVSGAGLEPDR